MAINQIPIADSVPHLKYLLIHCTTDEEQRLQKLLKRVSECSLQQ